MVSIQQLMLVIILMANDGSYSSTATPVMECPDFATFAAEYETRRNAKEFKSWVGYCTIAEFGFEAPTPEIGV